MSAQPDLLVQQVSSPRLTRSGTGDRLSLLLDLAGVHARRMLRQPVLLVGVAWAVLGMGLGFPDTPYEEYSALTGLVAMLSRAPQRVGFSTPGKQVDEAYTDVVA